MRVNRFKADCANTTFEAKAEYSTQQYAPTEIRVNARLMVFITTLNNQQHRCPLYHVRNVLYKSDLHSGHHWEPTSCPL